MRYRPLGQTGMHVSTLSLGTMMFGPAGNPDHTACAQILHAAIDAGINLVDTADMYSDMTSFRDSASPNQLAYDRIRLVTDTRADERLATKANAFRHPTVNVRG